MIEEGFLQWFGYLEKRRMVGLLRGSRSVGQLHKWWIDTVNDCLKKKRFANQASKENGKWRSLVGDPGSP